MSKNTRRTVTHEAMPADFPIDNTERGVSPILVLLLPELL
jgi:hypothetical protein